jgi:hypothetical protein
MDVATFKARYTEFNDVADEVVATNLEECKTLVSETATGKKYQILVFLLVAHELTLIDDNTSGSVEVSRSINGGSRTVKNIATDENSLYYSKSKYGLKYLAMKQTVRYVGAVLCESMQN